MLQAVKVDLEYKKMAKQSIWAALRGGLGSSSSSAAPNPQLPPDNSFEILICWQSVRETEIPEPRWHNRDRFRDYGTTGSS
jgi:hypothetical protein